MSGEPSLGRKALVTGITAGLIAVMANNGLRTAASITGQSDFAIHLPFPGSRLLADHALALVKVRAPFGEIARYASAAAAISPVAEPAFAGAALASDNREQASALLDQAQALSRRDPEVLAARFNLARQSGDASGELRAAERLFRLQMAPAGLGQVLGFDLAKPAVMRATVAALGSDYRWRAQFLSDAAQVPASRPGLVDMVEQVARARYPLTRVELAPLAGSFNLERADEAALALRVWRTVAPRANLLAWQGAEASNPAMAFDWNLVDNARVTGDGSEAKLEFQSVVAPAQAVARKRLPIDRGAYVVRMVDSDRGTMLGVRCGAVRQRVENGGLIRLNAACPAAEIAVFAGADSGSIGAITLERQGS